MEHQPATLAERGHLADLERTIEQGLRTFVAVGSALREIKEAKLYRESFASFGDYCRQRWGFSRGRAYQLINEATDGNGARSVKPARQIPPSLTDDDPPEDANSGPTARWRPAEVVEPSDDAGAQRWRSCANCGGMEFDAEGDCVACFEPAARDEEEEPAEKPAGRRRAKDEDVGLARKILAVVEMHRDEHPEIGPRAAATILRSVADQLDTEEGE